MTGNRTDAGLKQARTKLEDALKIALRQTNPGICLRGSF